MLPGSNLRNLLGWQRCSIRNSGFCKLSHFHGIEHILTDDHRQVLSWALALRSSCCVSTGTDRLAQARLDHLGFNQHTLYGRLTSVFPSTSTRIPGQTNIMIWENPGKGALWHEMSNGYIYFSSFQAVNVTYTHRPEAILLFVTRAIGSTSVNFACYFGLPYGFFELGQACNVLYTIRGVIPYYLDDVPGVLDPSSKKKQSRNEMLREIALQIVGMAKRVSTGYSTRTVYLKSIYRSICLSCQWFGSCRFHMFIQHHCWVK